MHDEGYYLIRWKKKKKVVIKYIYILLGLFKVKENNIFLTIYVCSNFSEGCKPMPK